LNFFKDLFKDKKIKKGKPESRELPKGKKSNSKGIRIFIWAILLIVAIAGPLGFLRSTNALKYSKEANAQLQNNDEKEMENQEAYDSPKFNVYANHVVDDYINIPKDGDERDDYLEQLQTIFVSEDFLPNLDFKGFRELNSKTYYGKEQEGDHVIAQYKVSYDTTVITEKKKKKKTVEEEETTSHEALVNIPIRYDDGFAVVESIYFTSVPGLKSDHQKQVTNPYDDENVDEVSVNDRDDLQNWVEDFFADYASKSSDEMAYMMDNPQALNGLQEFQEINDFHVYQKDGQYIVKAIVTYQEPEAGITHQEPYTMKIKQMNGKYYVKSLEQTLGGK